MTIKTKLTAWFISIAVLAGISSSIYGIYDDLTEANTRAIIYAEGTAKTIALAIASFDEPASHAPLHDTHSHIKDFIENMDRLVQEDIVVVDIEKKILGDAIPENVGQPFDHDSNDEVGQTIRDGVTRTFIEKSEDYPDGIRQLVVPIKVEKGGTVGAVIMVYTRYHNAYIAEAKSAMLYSSMSIVISLLVVGGIGYKVAATLSRPIVDLKEASDAIAAGNLDVNVEVESKDEIGDLAAAFNSMVGFRRAADEAVKASEERFRKLFENSNDAIFILAQDGRILNANQKAEAMTGYPLAVLTTMHVFALHPPEDLRKIEGPFMELISKGSVRLEARFLRPGGELIGVEISARFIDREKGILQGIVRDITARKKEEEKLEKAYQETNTANLAALNIMEDLDRERKDLAASLKEREALHEQLERVNKELSSFAYIVSHDLKAPLRGIGTIANWLAADYGDKLGDDGKMQLDILLQRTRRMHDMIEGILQYSRTGRIKGTPESVDTRKLAEHVKEALAPPENIQINIHESMPTITIDPVQINQIIQNLISNAINYMDKPEGVIDVGCKDAGDCWEFYVKDNGPGIEEKHFDKIFQIFQTLKPKDEYESTGIGLSIVKKTIEHNGGRIWVESEVGKGSSFKFTIPKDA